MNILLKKTISFSKDPVGSLDHYGARAIAELAEQGRRLVRTGYTRWCRWQLQRRGLLALLANRPTTAYAPYCEDLWLLYRLVRKLKPQCVLEFGAGCSTVAMAQAIHENGTGHLYSVDAVEYWARVTSELMPKHLQSVTTCSATEMVAVEIGGTRALRHAVVPDVVPDLIFLDGPDFQDFHLGTTDAVSDPVDMERHFKAGFCMVVDGRVENTNFLRSHLKRRYSVTHHWPQEPWETTIFRLQE
jgi:hypothetical protein